MSFSSHQQRLPNSSRRVKNVFLSRWSFSYLPLLLLLIPRSATAQVADTEQVFGGHLDAVTMGAFTPDGSEIVTVSFDHTVRLWDVASQAELRQYRQHTGPILCLAVSGDGTTLITGAQDNTMRVWDLPRSKPLSLFSPHQTKASAIAISPRGNSLVSASADQSVQIRSLDEDDQEVSLRSGHTSEVLSVAYRNDGAYFASGDAAGRVLLWSPYLDEPQGELTVHAGAVGQLQFASNNQQLFTAGTDGFVRLWQSMPSVPTKIDIGDTQIIDWASAGSQSQAVCIAEGGKAFVLNWTSGEITAEYPKLDFKPAAVACAPNNNWVCIADEAGRAHLLDFGDGSPRGVVSGHQGAVLDVAIHPDSTRFATCGADGSVRVWGQPPANDQPLQPLQTLQVSPDALVARHEPCVFSRSTASAVRSGRRKDTPVEDQQW